MNCEANSQNRVAIFVSKNSAMTPFSQVRYVFLDRDGVINRKAPEGQYVSRWSDFHILSGVESAISLLNRSGYKVIVVTNQRGVSLGLYTEQDILNLHDRLSSHLTSFDAHIDAIYYCPHNKNECDCRKPGIALFEQAFGEFPDASPANSVMIGDSISDIEAGNRLGMPTIFIQGEQQNQKPGAEQAARLATEVAGSLSQAVERFLI
jgi:D-glycero-D-manno-heptose 1,7-bisphosphate phosphatase